MSGLSPMTTDQELKAAFEKFGEILTFNIIKDHISKVSREFGFIKFNDKDSADSAIREMNGIILNEKEIRVEVARRIELRKNQEGRYMGASRYPRETERNDHGNRDRRDR